MVFCNRLYSTAILKISQAEGSEVQSVGVPLSPFFIGAMEGAAEGRAWWLFLQLLFDHLRLPFGRPSQGTRRKMEAQDGKDREGVVLGASQANDFSQDYESGLWCCSASPTGAHHWIIDDRGWGLCRYCGEKRQFAESVADCEAVGECEWDHNFLIRCEKAEVEKQWLATSLQLM